MISLFFMKFITYILSFIILSMVIIPCTDTIYGTNKSNGSTFEIKKPVTEQSQKQKDDCSPVCNCQCCGNLITIPTLYLFKKLTNTIHFTRNFAYSFHYSYKFAKGIWHPPLFS